MIEHNKKISGNRLIISLMNCSITLLETPGFEDSISKIIGNQKFVSLDLRHLHRIDSEGLNCFLSLLKRQREKGGDLKLVHLNRDIQALLELTKLDQLFIDKQHPHLEEMIEKLTLDFAHKKRWSSRIVYWRKKLFWHLFIGSAQAIKRSLDIFLAFVLFVLSLPILLICAVVIKSYDGGPVLYITNRLGKGGKEFRFPKLRSMHIDAEKRKEGLLPLNKHASRASFKMANDPRITWFGRILRRSSLDELPQLWCVLKGEMSLVGPRPPLPQEVEWYSLEQRKRLDVRPGLTCLWQVSGRSDLPFERQFELDMEYIQSQSLALDLKILLKTIPTVLLGKGAY